jgi:hypothetical protein
MAWEPASALGRTERSNTPIRTSTIRIRYIMELFYIELDQMFSSNFSRNGSFRVLTSAYFDGNGPIAAEQICGSCRVLQTLQ